MPKLTKQETLLKMQANLQALENLSCLHISCSCCYFVDDEGHCQFPPKNTDTGNEVKIWVNAELKKIKVPNNDHILEWACAAKAILLNLEPSGHYVVMKREEEFDKLLDFLTKIQEAA